MSKREQRYFTEKYPRTTDRPRLGIPSRHFTKYIVRVYLILATLTTPEPGVDPEFIEINTQEESGKNHDSHL